ncbi:glutamate-5-semialdehyde dehydrogenase [Mariniblastus fucicola]|uniref:Gamma-glutamyl phosphate reductase n=1 Tax=Mariniblastus fucicola TaxID=980251 RepID=A0A5B9PE67_9BACT|nr:glutamate-5-semialdehyde dehydrogenase [Mariniblastus fucicola]QEG22866.1 Gamma-glutamyl phosphate reductase [Mariniblastus fucicola]
MTESTKLNVADAMLELGKNARTASRILATANAAQKRTAINVAAEEIEKHADSIKQKNSVDVAAGREANLSSAMIDRLELNDDRIAAMVSGLRAIAQLADPVGSVIAKWQRPNGLDIERVRTPLGVIGVIYESRPNVTADAGALCLMAGNAVILRGGSDSIHSSTAILSCLQTGLEIAGLPVESIQMVPTTDRAAVGEMLAGLGGNIDVIVPRGGKGLVGRVQADCRVPVFAHLEGICHVFVDASADLEMAVEVVHNAKMRRTGVCGAAETLLIHENVVASHLKPILERLAESGCEIRGDEAVCSTWPAAKPASEEDWSAEYLEAILSVKVVSNVDEAIAHISQHSSGHTESIISENPESVAKFFNSIDSAILLHNASTQFADGGEFGMGAEIGIATGKMHARGPVGVEQLTSFNYRVRGNGQTRP